MTALEDHDDHMVSFAQNAEDVVLWRLFKGRGSPGFYVDVGAAHPVVDSVTKWFSLRGWTGINIEPEPSLFRQLVRDRVRDVNREVACGAHPGKAELLVATAAKWGQSTLDDEQMVRLRDGGWASRSISVEVVRLDSVIDEWSGATPIDFLKIDVEGSEANVLAGASLERTRPRVVVIESTVPDSRAHTHAKWESLLVDAGYVDVLFDGISRFYCGIDDDEARDALSWPANVSDHFVTHREFVLRMSVEAMDELLTAASAEVSAAIDMLRFANGSSDA